MVTLSRFCLWQSVSIHWSLWSANRDSSLSLVCVCKESWMPISPFERDISMNYINNSYIKSTNNAGKTHFMPRESWPTGSLRFLLLLVSFLRKKPSGNQSVLCSRLRRAINIPTIKITNKKREATPTSSSLPHWGNLIRIIHLFTWKRMEIISMIIKYSWTYVWKQLSLCKCGYLPRTSFMGYGKFNISLAEQST